MNRIVASIFLLVVALGVASNAQQAPIRPNVLFVISDDLGVRLPSYGGFPAITPNLDAFTKVSTQFQRSYVSVAICAPSRTAFLTGLRPDSTHVVTIGPYFRNMTRDAAKTVTLPQRFKQAGYNASGAGKIFHPGNPSGGLLGGISPQADGGGDMPHSWTGPFWFCDHFDNETVWSPPMQEYPCVPKCGDGCVQSAECIQCFKKAGTWGVNRLAWSVTDCDDICYPDGLVAHRSVQALRWYAANPTVPFFYGVGFKRPHSPYRGPRKYFDMYRLNDTKLPKYTNNPPTMPALGIYRNWETRTRIEVAPYVNDSNFTARIMNDSVIRHMRYAYSASITFMDAQFGKVMDEFYRLGLDKNTIVVFMGDNGYRIGEKAQWAKENNDELATRIPLLIAAPTGWEDYARGVVVPNIVESIDIYPTLLEMANLSQPVQPRPLPGQSLVPLLTQKGSVPKTWALSQWPRREICTHAHINTPQARKCNEGNDDPTGARMGYTLRTDSWRYTAWMHFNYTTWTPIWDKIAAEELYDHSGDEGTYDDCDNYEYDNLAGVSKYASVKADLRSELYAAIKTGL